jgi:hypothetical protein
VKSARFALPSRRSILTERANEAETERRGTLSVERSARVDKKEAGSALPFTPRPAGVAEVSR